MTLTEMDFFPSNFMLQTTSHEADNNHQQHHLYHQPPTSLPQSLPSCSSQDFHGVASLLGKRSMPFSGVDMCEETHNKYEEDDSSDNDGSQIGKNKRRLNIEQVKTLEKNFVLGNKLEPERKLHLARALGLQPRQIAIWFQNRRARWKTKQLEKDYEILKGQFDAVKAENESLQAHSKKLLAEIMELKQRESIEPINLNIKETDGSCRSDEKTSDVKLDISRTVPTTTSPIDEDCPILLSSKPSLFSPSSSLRPITSGIMGQLSQTSSRLALHYQKTDQTTHQVKEESLSNMFCSIDNQTAFWPWLEQSNFN